MLPKPIAYLLVLGVLALAACERTIDFPLPFAGEQLVVLARFDPTSVMAVEVSRTASALADSVPWVTDATVAVYESDTLLEILPYVGEGLYRSALGHMPIAAASYQLKVYTPDDSVFSAKVVIPEQPQVKRIEALPTYYVTVNGTAHLLRIQLGDGGAEERFYALNVYADAPGNIRLRVNYAFFLPYDADCNPDGGLFTQRCIQESGRPIELPIQASYFDRSTNMNRNVDTTWVWLTAYDEATYTYYQAMRNPAGDFDQVFLPPAPLPNFMTGGYGILAVQHVQKFEVILQ
jgi:hypothetical protein